MASAASVQRPFIINRLADAWRLIPYQKAGCRDLLLPGYAVLSGFAMNYMQKALCCGYPFSYSSLIASDRDLAYGVSMQNQPLFSVSNNVEPAELHALIREAIPF